MNFCIARHALAVALPLLLTGCASLIPSDSTRNEAAARPAPDATALRPFHGTIDLGGRLSVRYQGPRNEEVLHGSFTWIQTLTQTTVTLLSPLGQTLAIIEVTPQGATLTQEGQAMRSAADVDLLTAAALGWPLPVAGLRDWLQGFAVDRAGHRVVATPQAADITTRDGWRIQYLNWQGAPLSSTQTRPKRIDLARFTEQAGDVSIRIVIDSWQAH